MQETNNLTNLTRLSSFLLLDMLLLIEMTWNTHLSAKNTERKKNNIILGDCETREESIGKRCRSWTMLDLTGFRLMRTVAHGRSRSFACRESRRTSPSETPDAQHGCTIAFALQQWHVAFSGGSSFFTNWAGLFCFASFLFFFLFFAFFFFWNATAYFAQFAIRGYAPGIVEKQLKKKQAYWWLKNKEPGERNVTFWSLILMFIFRKVPIFRACKNAKIALQHPIIFGVFASPWTTLKTEKRNFAFSWEMKSVSGHLKLFSFSSGFFFFINFEWEEVHQSWNWSFWSLHVITCTLKKRNWR